VTDAPALRSQRFRREREDDWRRLARLLDKLESAPAAQSLTDEELLAVPVLYRSALSSLSVARATSLDAALIDYLESLCARAYFFVYGTRARFGERVAGFFARDWSAAVRALWPETLVSGGVFVLAAVAAYLLVTFQPDWYFGIMGAEMAQGRDPSSSAAELREVIYGGNEDDTGLGVFATFLFTHNAQVSLMAFALGFCFGLPTVLLLAGNGLSLGAFVALHASKGLGVEIGGWLAIHGSTELFAIVLAGAAGLRIGRAVAFPGDHGRLEAAAAAGKTAALVMAGVVVMLFCAGLLEGFGRQLIEVDALRYAVGAAMLTLWLVYLYAPRPGRP
jgi:uncharacterized membrane protein SpoIIM required for sporulation